MQKVWKSWQLQRVLLVLVFSLVLSLGMEYLAHGSMQAVVTWVTHRPPYVLLTTGFIGGCYYITVCISGQFFFSTLFWYVISWLWGSVNYLKYTMRSEYVTGDDLLSFLKGELTFTKDDVTLSRHLFYYAAVVALMLLLSFLIQHFHAPKKEKKRTVKKRLLHAAAGLCVTLIAAFGVYFTENLTDYMGDVDYLENKYGLLLSLIPNNTLPHLITQEDYTPLLSEDYVRAGKSKKEDIDGVAEGETKNTSSVKPNIIVIMSESLYDTDHFDNVVSDKDPMTVMHHYQKEYGGGSLASDIFGGGTANTEFEFLTGIGHKYFASNLMYNNYINEGQMSMVGYMNELGYHTVAIHPYKGDFFNRKNVYQAFGFSEMYFKENMKYTDDLFDINISDYCLTKEIIDKYEKNKDSGKPLFNFSVSVGAHKPCLDYDKGHPYQYKSKVKVADLKSQEYRSTMDVRRFFSAVYDANVAFEELVSYFEKVEEPTVILLFGDHAPPFTDDAYASAAKHKLSEEELYQTPVVTWNNYGLSKLSVDNVNANYLSAIFLSYLNFPLPKMCVYNQNLMKYWYHSNTKKSVRDEEGKKIQSLSEERIDLEKASLRLYQDALSMKKETLDLWEVPEE